MNEGALITGITTLLLGLLFSILSIIFLKGNGSNLIAGYNTMSESEKEEYDEEKICKSTGKSMLVVTILVFIFSIFSFLFSFGFISDFIFKTVIVLFIIFTTLMVVISIIFSNKKCLKNKK